MLLAWDMMVSMERMLNLIQNAEFMLNSLGGDADSLNVIATAREVIAIVQELAKADPVGGGGNGSVNSCVFCNANDVSYQMTPHEQTCLWLRAVEVCK